MTIAYFFIALLIAFLIMLWLYVMPDFGHGDPNDEIDFHRTKQKYKVTFTKTIRCRYNWSRYVVGYYKWYWFANAVATIVFYFNGGDVNISKRNEVA